jgi:hypothetical protein
MNRIVADTGFEYPSTGAHDRSTVKAGKGLERQNVEAVDVRTPYART